MEPRAAFSILRVLLELNVMLVAALAGARAAVRMGGLSHRSSLRLAQALFLLAIALPFLAPALPRRVLAAPAAQVWSSGDVGGTTPRGVTFVGTRRGEGPRPVALDDGALGLAVLALSLLAAGRVAWLAARLLLLRRALGRMPVIRSIGRVRIVATPSEPVPYSAWLFGRAYVVVPEALVLEPASYAIAVRHEIAHHRQRDTLWVQAFEAACAPSFWNPAVRSWGRLFSELMELACDEILVTRRRVDPRAYARCLVETARAAIASRPLVATTAMAAPDDTFLRRRIQMMLATRTPSGRRPALATLAALLALGGTAYALQSSIQERVIGMEQARELAARAERTAGFTVVMNEQVLARLNRLVGTPEGREFLQGAFQRMPEHRPALERRLVERGLPASLVAVALVESGFRNNEGIPTEPSLAPGMRGAGIWMFIPATARRYGLRVDPAAGIDERLDVAKETDAAIAYLGKLHRQFGDWHLALAAYNQGERHVERALADSGVRDPFLLAEQGKLNDYVATVMAGVVILANPAIVD